MKLFKLFKLFLLTALIPLILTANEDRPPVTYNYLSKANVQHFITMMHTRYGFDRDYLKQIFKQARLDRDTLARYTGKFKKNTTVGSWECSNCMWSMKRPLKKHVHLKNIIKKHSKGQNVSIVSI